MPRLSDALRIINALQEEGVVEGYAVGGAMAMLFWAEPTVTYDLDIFILVSEAHDVAMPKPVPTTPSAKLFDVQVRAKQSWHRQAAGQSIAAKVRLLLRMQRELYPIISQRRAMQPWERPWPIDG